MIRRIQTIGNEGFNKALRAAGAMDLDEKRVMLLALLASSESFGGLKILIDDAANYLREIDNVEGSDQMEEAARLISRAASIVGSR